MASRSVKSMENSDSEYECYNPIEPKAGHMDINETTFRNDSIESWQQMQDKILRVLTYKYYDSDVTIIHMNESYMQESRSTFCLEEEELENFYLQEYTDLLCLPLELKITRSIMPSAEEAQIVTVDEDEGCCQLSKCFREFLALVTCQRICSDS